MIARYQKHISEVVCYCVFYHAKVFKFNLFLVFLNTELWQSPEVHSLGDVTAHLISQGSKSIFRVSFCFIVLLSLAGCNSIIILSNGHEKYETR